MKLHTPGPWKRGEKYDAGRIYGKSVGGVQLVEREFALAEVRGWGHLSYLPNGAEIQDANARLIEAAPEFYESALWITKLNGTTDPQGLEELREEVCALRALLRRVGSE